MLWKQWEGKKYGMGGMFTLCSEGAGSLGMGRMEGGDANTAPQRAAQYHHPGHSAQRPGLRGPAKYVTV